MQGKPAAKHRQAQATRQTQALMQAPGKHNHASASASEKAHAKHRPKKTQCLAGWWFSA